MGRKVVLYIATSLDGYIAKPNDDLGFLSIVEQEGEDYGYSNFVKTVDAVIVGRKTYDKVIDLLLITNQLFINLNISSKALL